jgi:RHS repeat-associated protein
LGGIEIYREYNARGQVVEEIETHHLFLGDQRVLIVDDVVRTERADYGAGAHFRYQYSNHLGSACVELDAGAAVITYEEYHPYGTSAYQAGRSAVEVSRKRYRYTGKERDAETGLNYHSARYYAPWLGRWVNCDPVGISGGCNLYNATWSNPLRNVDLYGATPRSPDAILSDIREVHSNEVASQQQVAGLTDRITRAEIELALARRLEPRSLGERFERWRFIREGQANIRRMQREVQAANRTIATLDQQLRVLTREGLAAGISDDAILRAQGLEDPFSHQSQTEAFDRASGMRQRREGRGGESDTADTQQVRVDVSEPTPREGVDDLALLETARRIAAASRRPPGPPPPGGNSSEQQRVRVEVGSDESGTGDASAGPQEAEQPAEAESESSEANRGENRNLNQRTQSNFQMPSLPNPEPLMWGIPGLILGIGAGIIMWRFGVGGGVIRPGMRMMPSGIQTRMPDPA